MEEKKYIKNKWISLKKAKIYWCLALIICTLAIYNTINYSKSNNNVKIECSYMNYACGDCYTNYKIQKVYRPTDIKENLRNKEINIKFNSNKLNDKFEKEVKDGCEICYKYKFVGNLRYSILDGYYSLIVVSYSLNFNKACCDSTTIDQ